MDYTIQQIRQWDQDHVWHPFTPMKDYDDGNPLIIEAADGVRIRDVDGNWYYDGVSSVWLNVHGHHVAEINQAIIDQLQEIAHSTLLGQGNVPISVLAHKLHGVTPQAITRFFFSDSGASAVEVGLKMAIQFWANQGNSRKTKILGFTTNYHGDTMGAMAVAPDPLFHWPFLDALPKHPRVKYPDCYRCPLNLSYPRCQLACTDLVEESLRENQDVLAAVIIEVVQGAGGMIPAPPGFLSRLRALCDQYHVLLIVDEVATGVGRTGKFWAIEHDGVTPDILCMGKGVSGGYLPLSVTATTEAVYQQFYCRAQDRKALYHGHSYAGNQLAAAASVANLDLIESTHLIAHVEEMARRIQPAIESFRDLPYVGDVRQKGLMIGIELAQDPEKRIPFPYARQAGRVIQEIARSKGMILRPIGNVVIFMPPLASKADELAEMIAILDSALKEGEHRLSEVKDV
ncbi:MAG: adenosylmethionine--8-amino-7-oxononanoate transaminase [Sulfobacillus benefaciens]|uniref:Adenosylmethionine-8-amino-7-oxononanoate aminotransferase n=1 Tax=Sulfobacillus benefaciens TaxID=453960 RepID=A0A2T2WRG1_9FIRM|nr:MAG: adenosylmethionine--8-amino-7-oxononanoate transaminase [Sulfobacillus benefaciens]